MGLCGSECPRSLLRATFGLHFFGTPPACVVFIRPANISSLDPTASHTSRRASATDTRPRHMSDDAAPDTGAAKTPADFLKSIRGKPVVVKLNSGVDYRGILACLDGYMNIAMEQTEVSASHDHLAAEGLTDASDAIERRVSRVERWHPRLDCAPAS